jgi:sulfide:quinone oxidoreductase
MTRTLILGAGFGGITVAIELRRLLGDDHEVILVDSRPDFFMGLRKLWALVGIGSIEEGSRPRQALEMHGIRFLRREVTAIDPAGRTAKTDEGILEGDHLVVALGAEPRADLVPGLAEHANIVYDRAAIPSLRSAVEAFQGGRIALVIAGGPYKCPPAPYECTMLLDDHLRDRGIRDRTQIIVSTFQPMLLPNAGAEGSAWLGEQLAARDIEFHVGRKVERVEAGRFAFSDGSLEADLLIGVPPHRPPAVVKASGLTGDGEWVPVDRSMLETTYDRVFAIGDLTQIKLANGLALPKAGLMAERQGEVVAAAIAAALRGAAPPPGFDGHGYCFIEMGKAMATRVEGDFYATPEPEVALQEVSAANAEAKHRWETERLDRWFGTTGERS